ncbi:MAG: acetyl-CoA carboxylase biotin carboxyl carrier protein subunit [Verrucomicrobiaceae bacterium]|nr:MAG: acetyl-CoA carboxylase biotin carboxyl carrier protein subunit [Verrucomicrobiaceae bacterium]
MKKLRVTVDGKSYDVAVEILDDQGKPAALQQTAPLLQQTSVAPPASSAPKPSSAPAAGAGSVTSPLAGRIVSVDCQVGQKVASGAQLVTVEAMKMNTFVYAESDGTVASVSVNPGDTVDEGQVLVTLS